MGPEGSMFTALERTPEQGWAGAGARTQIREWVGSLVPGRKLMIHSGYVVWSGPYGMLDWL